MRKVGLSVLVREVVIGLDAQRRDCLSREPEVARQAFNACMMQAYLRQRRVPHELPQAQILERVRQFSAAEPGTDYPALVRAMYKRVVSVAEATLAVTSCMRRCAVRHNGMELASTQRHLTGRCCVHRRPGCGAGETSGRIRTARAWAREMGRAWRRGHGFQNGTAAILVTAIAGPVAPLCFELPPGAGPPLGAMVMGRRIRVPRNL